MLIKIAPSLQFLKLKKQLAIKEQLERERLEREFRGRLDERLKSDSIYQQVQRLDRQTRKRRAIERLAKEIKQFNEKRNTKSGQSFEAAGDSYEKAKTYAENLVRLNDLKEK